MGRARYLPAGRMGVSTDLSARHPPMAQKKTRVLILGGGFAGVYTAMYLERSLKGQERQDVEISLVNLENYLVFQPMLPEVISGSIEILHVICPIRRLAPATRLFSRRVEE